MKKIRDGSLKTIKRKFNATDEIAYLRSRDFLACDTCQVFMTAFLDLKSARMVNIDVIVNIA